MVSPVNDLDGIVQAIEDPDHDFLVGVQWHPEFLILLGCQRKLFRELVAHARRQSTTTNSGGGSTPAG